MFYNTCQVYRTMYIHYPLSLCISLYLVYNNLYLMILPPFAFLPLVCLMTVKFGLASSKEVFGFMGLFGLTIFYKLHLPEIVSFLYYGFKFYTLEWALYTVYQYIVLGMALYVLVSWLSLVIETFCNIFQMTINHYNV
jgi:hypothetical protein